MALKSFFRSIRGAFVPPADTTNREAAPAFERRRERETESGRVHLALELSQPVNERVFVGRDPRDA